MGQALKGLAPFSLSHRDEPVGMPGVDVGLSAEDVTIATFLSETPY